jgi:hypothetical protein
MRLAPLCLLTSLGCLLFPVPEAAQGCPPDPLVIDFECNPADGQPFGDGEFVTNQYNVSPWFVTFSLIGAPAGTGPMIAKVGSPQTAFQGPSRSDSCTAGTTQDDMPAAGQNVGCFFLTDDGINRPLAYGLLITYQNGVRQAGGDLLDVEPCCESWQITALDQNQQVLASTQVSWSDAGAGDGVATTWSFDLDSLPTPPSESIRYIRLEYTGDTNHNVGLAFDNFSPSSLPVPVVRTSWGGIKAKRN